MEKKVNKRIVMMPIDFVQRIWEVKHDIILVIEEKHSLVFSNPFELRHRWSVLKEKEDALRIELKMMNEWYKYKYARNILTREEWILTI